MPKSPGTRIAFCLIDDSSQPVIAPGSRPRMAARGPAAGPPGPPAPRSSPPAAANASTGTLRYADVSRPDKNSGTAFPQTVCPAVSRNVHFAPAGAHGVLLFAISRRVKPGRPWSNCPRAVAAGGGWMTPPPHSVRHLPYSAGEAKSPLRSRGDVVHRTTGGSAVGGRS